MAVVLTALLVAGSPVDVDTSALPNLQAAVAFQPRSREVTNWRREAVGNLDLPWTAAVRLGTGRDLQRLPRCVRLNNYWCIKRAGWAGEIAADAEGHVAFASAREGADVAALLLRRYYVDLGRHSAFAIVSHWAPVQCGAAPMTRGVGHLPVQADRLATRGLGNTLRARFLAARGRRGGRPRRSAVPDRPVAQLRAPAIAVGLGERPVALPAALSLTAPALAALGPASGAPLASCAGDSQRIRAYADRTAAGVAATAKDDLMLFAPDGTPTARLARVMRNMAAVEIGPLGVDAGLVDRAVAHLAERPAAVAVKASPDGPVVLRR